jgi:hypothetical protein
VIGGDDPTPWRNLADGTVVAIEHDGDVIAITVERRAARVKLLLAGCDAVRYQPHDEPMLYELEAIASSQPDIREAAYEKGVMVVRGGAGTLFLTYANLTEQPL